MNGFSRHFRRFILQFTLGVVCFSATGLAEEHIWTNTAGTEIRAEFRGVSEANVHLRTDDGTDYILPLAKLSAASRAQAARLNDENPLLARILDAPAPYRYRFSEVDRFKRVRNQGGTVESEKAIQKGLEWLVESQNPDGSFGMKYLCATTGLSMLAMLGQGHDLDSELCGDSLVKAAMFLMKSARTNDNDWITVGGKGNHISYEHGIGTLALAELYSMTKNTDKEIPGLESILSKSVNVIVRGQTDLGSWAYGYRVNGRDDLSVSGWQYQALHAAQLTGREFRDVERAMDRAQDYLTKAQDPKGAFKYTVENAAGKPSLTGVALLCLQLGEETDSTHYKKGRTFLDEQYSFGIGNNFYAPYYFAHVAFNDPSGNWKKHRDAIVTQLVDSQNEDGSWTGPHVGGHGSEDSLHTNTTWAILIFEGYYRYVFPNQ